MNMAWTEIVRSRLARQYLTTTGPRSGADVVSALGAVQAQDYAGAKWALGLRAPDATDASVERELAEGGILRTHVLRPTWHFVSPADIRWMIALTAPRLKAVLAYQDRRVGVAPALVRRSNAALRNALTGGKHLTRAELAAALKRARVQNAAGQRLSHLMMHAEIDAVVCSGPRRGNQATYALLDERVPPAAAIERDEALLALTRRYFDTRGPATHRDFAWWSGLPAADAKRGIQIAGRELERVVYDGEQYHQTERAVPKATRSAHLLPNYDEYFIGYKDRSAVGKRLGHSTRVIGGDARITHVVFVDGQLVGGWRRILENDVVRLELELACRLSPVEERRVVAAAPRFGMFLGRVVRIS